MRVTPDNITRLKPNEVFVFGSNEIGAHGKGAAKTAMKWGAKYGRSFGLQGQTFGIPTCDYRIHSLPLTKIKYWVDRFITVAKIYGQQQPELKFLVTEIGCGLAGHRVKDIAPMFKECVDMENVYLPERFWRVLEKNTK